MGHAPEPGRARGRDGALKAANTECGQRGDANPGLRRGRPAPPVAEGGRPRGDGGEQPFHGALPGVTHCLGGGPPGDRTRDTLIKSQVLYH